jgi:hypothetical protein
VPTEPLDGSDAALVPTEPLDGADDAPVPDEPLDGSDDPIDSVEALGWADDPIDTDGPLGCTDDALVPDKPLGCADDNALDGPGWLDGLKIGCKSLGELSALGMNASEEALGFPKVDDRRGSDGVEEGSGASGPADNGPISRTRHSASPQVSERAAGAKIAVEMPVRTAIVIAPEQPTTAAVFIFPSCTTIECPIANPRPKAWFRAGRHGGGRSFLRFIGNSPAASAGDLPNRPCTPSPRGMA